MGEHQVRLERTDQADEGESILQGGQQLTVVVVEDEIFGADNCSGGGGLGLAPRGQGGAGLKVVAGVAVGQADHLDGVAGGPVQRGGAPGGIVGVVGVSAEDEQAQG